MDNALNLYSVDTTMIKKITPNTIRFEINSTYSITDCPYGMTNVEIDKRPSYIKKGMVARVGGLLCADCQYNVRIQSKEHYVLCSNNNLIFKKRIND